MSPIPLLRSRAGISGFVLAIVLCPGLAAAQSFTHVHLRSPDPAAAAEWYHTLLGGDLRPSTAGMGAVAHIHGSISTMLDEANAEPSAGSVIDHFGFAVSDVPAMVARARFMGAQIVADPSPGVTANMIAMIEDPWGTRVELLESPDFTGIQHVHMVAEDVEALRDWFLQVFGGEYDPQSGDDSFHAIRYDGIWIYLSEAPEPPDRLAFQAPPDEPGELTTMDQQPFPAEAPSPVHPPAPGEMSTMDELAAMDELTVLRELVVPVRGIVPSRGRSLDHIGFSVPNMDEVVSRIRASGYEPYVIRPNRPGGTTLLMFFEGANGVHFEIAQPNGVE